MELLTKPILATASDEDEAQQEYATTPMSCEMLSTLKSRLIQSEFNWFEFHNVDLKTMSWVLSNYPVLLNIAAESERSTQQRTENALNGDIATDSETDNPEIYIRLDPKSENGRTVIAKWRAAIRRRARRLRGKMMSARQFLCHKTSKRVSKILLECPDIGSVIESYVQERNIGADAWCRTGVLTFDGNGNLKEKVTYERIHCRKPTIVTFSLELLSSYVFVTSNLPCLAVMMLIM